jgi:AcrR family transcriptional regulator
VPTAVGSYSKSLGVGTETRAGNVLPRRPFLAWRLDRRGRKVNIVNMTAPRREQILTIARDLFLTRGLAGLSMRRVAAGAGISATAIYRHYKDKQALLQAMVEEGHQVFASYLFRALSGKTPYERLRLSAQSYLAFAIEQPKYYQLIFMSWSDEKQAELATRDRDPDRKAPTFQFLLDRVGECIGEGVFRKGTDPMDAALGAWSLVHGLATLWLTGGGRYQFSEAQYRERCDAVVKQMMRGLLA